MNRKSTYFYKLIFNRNVCTNNRFKTIRADQKFIEAVRVVPTTHPHSCIHTRTTKAQCLVCPAALVLCLNHNTSSRIWLFHSVNPPIDSLLYQQEQIKNTNIPFFPLPPFGTSWNLKLLQAKLVQKGLDLHRAKPPVAACSPSTEPIFTYGKCFPSFYSFPPKSGGKKICWRWAGRIFTFNNFPFAIKGAKRKLVWRQRLYWIELNLARQNQSKASLLNVSGERLRLNILSPFLKVTPGRIKVKHRDSSNKKLFGGGGLVADRLLVLVSRSMGPMSMQMMFCLLPPSPLRGDLCPGRKPRDEPMIRSSVTHEGI